MTRQSSPTNTIDARLYLLAAVLGTIWVLSLAAMGWWFFLDQERSEHILDQHRVTADLSAAMLREALALERDLSSLTNAERSQAPVVVYDHLDLAMDSLKRLRLQEGIGGHAANVVVMEWTNSAMDLLDRAASENPDDFTRLVELAQHLRYRIEQLQRIHLLDYNHGLRQATQARQREQILVALALLVLAVIAFLVFNYLLRYVRSANQQLADNANLLRQSTRVGNLGYSRWTANSAYCVEASEEFLDMLGLSRTRLASGPLDLEEFIQLIHPLDQHYREKVQSLANGEELSYRIVTADNAVRHISEVSETGQDDSVLVITRDITQIKEAEEQLLQSQKMEVVGQLTGGVAHDFNNILAVIQGSLELIEQGELEPRQREFSEMAMQAAKRGASLTRQLLAFARRQPLHPEKVQMNELLLSMHELFIRTLGENIEVELIASSNCWPCHVDRGQLESALFNLVINSRDAMPGGGKLMVEASNVTLDSEYTSQVRELEAGDYVLISVTDNGKGMSAELVERIFEPFYTTKEVGKGTGLGLSMVYGFAKQSCGHITVYSEPDTGTTFKLYLPRATGEDEQAAPSPVAGVSANTSENPPLVLVVEDDPDVLSLVIQQLAALGYKTHQAESAEAAGEILANEPIDLLLTDVVLAGTTNGKELADTAVAAYPALKVVYMSGYTRNAVIHHGRLDPGTRLLQKPFSQAELEQTLARALIE